MVDDSRIRAFVELFDGDPVKAARALRDFSFREQKLRQQQKLYKPKSTEIIASARDIHKSYKIGKQQIAALSGASLDVYKGEFIALTGPSGSGKSTLLQLLGGLDKPTSGTVTIDGTDVSTLSDKKLSQFRNQTIGFVFQFFYLQPFLNVLTNTEIPGMFAGSSRHERKKHAEELVDKVGLGDRARHVPKELSGGQMQRAAIARALLNKPKLLLADEPTGNLDSTNGAAIIDLFEQIREQFGTTIILVTHDSSIAARADREVRMKDGVVL